MRSWLRSGLLFGLLLAGLALALVVTLDRRRHIGPEWLVRWWCRRLLPILGVEVEIHGQPLAGARMTVANHVSWLDIPLIASVETTRFVSKSEVRDWPVAGTLATAAGAFYLHRGKGGAAPLLGELIPHLDAGGTVVLFPEGTSTDGQGVRTFHPRLFAAAIESGCPVQPVALSYGRAESGDSIAPFVGDDTLLAHILRLLREPSLRARLEYLPALSTAGHDRDGLAAAAESAIRDAIEAAAAGATPEMETEELPVPESV